MFSEIYYPKGWKATIDGNEVPIERANYVLRAITIPQGEHDIEMRFEPQSYTTKVTFNTNYEKLLERGTGSQILVVDEFREAFALAIDGVFALFGGIQSKLVIPIVIGGVMLALGIALIILPNLFSDIFMVLLGILLILMGVTGALSILDNDKTSIPNIVFSAVIAVAMVVAGVFAIIYMDDAKDWVMILIGVLMIITGALNVGAGLLARQAVTQVKKL